MKIVRNTAIDQYRRNNKQNEWLSDQERGEEETNTFVKSVEDREFIQQLLNAVPAEYRRLLNYAVIMDFRQKRQVIF